VAIDPTHLPVFALSAFLVVGSVCGQAAPTREPALVDAAVAGRVINIDSFPRGPGETHDAPRFNRAVAAMQEGDVLQLNAATTYSIRSPIRGWRSNTTLAGADWTSVMKVESPGLTLIHVVGLTGFALRDLKLEGLATSNIPGNDGIAFVDVTHSRIANVRVDSFPWQGIVVGGSSHHNTLDTITVSNVQDARSGTGVLLWGNTVHDNVVSNVTAFNNRIGVSLNYAHHNTVTNVTAHDNTSIGFTLDGIEPGQGARFNTIGKVVANRNGSIVNFYGGVYLGNNSHGNTFESISCSDNASNGLYLNGGSTNTFASITVLGNKANGVRNYYGGRPDSEVSGNRNRFGTEHLNVQDNHEHGIFIQHGDALTIGNPAAVSTSQENSGAGIYLSREVTNTSVHTLHARSNAGVGVYTQPGGKPLSNQFHLTHSSGNRAGDYVWGTPVHEVGTW
jgi:parallel beta-helix repeat protein